jgi:hypothetical protein
MRLVTKTDELTRKATCCELVSWKCSTCFVVGAKKKAWMGTDSATHISHAGGGSSLSPRDCLPPLRNFRRGTFARWAGRLLVQWKLLVAGQLQLEYSVHQLPKRAITTAHSHSCRDLFCPQLAVQASATVIYTTLIVEPVAPDSSSLSLRPSR